MIILMSTAPALVSAAPPTVTVTYYSNGAQYETETVNSGGLASAPIAPAVPTGMVSFVGWSKEKNGLNNLYDFSAPVKENLNLFAQFSDKHLVSFKDADGDIYYTQLVEADDYVIPPEAPPSGTEDVFVYWVIDNTYDMYDFSLPVNSNIVLRPVYDNSYYIYFNSMKGTPVDKQLIGDGETVDEPADPTRPGYEFAFWSETMNADPKIPGNAYDFSAPVTESLTLYAIWRSDEVNKPEVKIIIWKEKEGLPIQFEKDNPSNYVYHDSFIIEEKAGTTITITEAEMNQDYDYYIPSNSEFYRSIPTVVEGDGTTAVNVYYTNTIYTVYFYLNSVAAEMVDDRQNPAPSTTYVNTANEDEQYSIEIKKDMDLENIWPLNGSNGFRIYRTDDASAFQGWMIPLGLNVETGTILNIIWVSKRLTVTAEMLPDSTYGTGTETEFVLSGYWINDGQTTNLRYMFEALPGETKTGTAGIDYVEYNGKLYINSTKYAQTAISDGTAFMPKSIEGKTALTEYALQFNAATEELEEMESTSTNFDQYFIYDRTRYDLSFDTVGGSTISDKTDLLAGEDLSGYKPANPTRPDYRFVDWYEDREYQKPYTFEDAIMPDRNLELFAKWEHEGVTATFYDQAGGTVLGTQSVALRESVQVPGNADPYFREIGTSYENLGVFKGWYQTLNNGLVVPYTFSNSIEKDVEIYGLYKTTGFKVTYDENGGTGDVPTDDETYKVNALAPVKNAALTKGSMILAGWQEKDKSGIIYYPGSTIKMNGNVDFEAVYANSDTLVNLIYNANYAESTETKTDTVIEGRSYALRDNQTFKRSGYVLTGWSETPGATTPDYNCGVEFLIPSGGTTLYATWEEVQYFTVTFAIRDADQNKGVITSQNVFKVEKGALSVLAIPVAVRPTVDIIPDADGELKYRFVGWESLPVTIQKDLIVYANFEDMEKNGGGGTGSATVKDGENGDDTGESKPEGPTQGYENPTLPGNPVSGFVTVSLIPLAIVIFAFVRKQDLEE
ncbi:InlB B-repeat-containing protein [Methanimicrococcus blatticola]|nr:InlB B-repeat-containing protein [Methanimicrococcus blatticola]MBZ3935246.1 InlB B-repeat-containing protein [Methanimicrococcus blatticola]MCC2508656.1 InlB B-repeat-containing protein [Methanimicrococcus blatticola]